MTVLQMKRPPGGGPRWGWIKRSGSVRWGVRFCVARLLCLRELFLERVDAREVKFVLLVCGSQVGGEVRGALRQHLDLRLQLADVAANAGRQNDLLGHDLSILGSGDPCAA